MRGAGVVLETWQETPQRQVALKTLRAGPWSESIAGRLRREAEVLAPLQHLGYARIHAAGLQRASAPMAHGRHEEASPIPAAEWRARPDALRSRR